MTLGTPQKEFQESAWFLRIPDLHTLQRKTQRLMMQNNIQIRSTIANDHKNPIITLFSGHISMNYLQEVNMKNPFPEVILL